MIINKKTEEETKEIKKNNDLLKKIIGNLTRKKIISIFVVIMLIIISIILINFFTKTTNISIEIASTNISYTYGPNSSTSSNIKIGDEIKLKILAQNALNIKCYSSNENVIVFKEKNIAYAKSNGVAQLYCKSGNQKSNIINVSVGD